MRTGQPRELATSSGLGWDAGVWNAVCASNGGAVLDIAVSGVDRYAPNPAGHSTLDLVDEADRYLPTLRRRLSALSGTAFDVVIYNAGMDVHEECAIGGLTSVTDAILAEREQRDSGRSPPSWAGASEGLGSALWARVCQIFCVWGIA